MSAAVGVWKRTNGTLTAVLMMPDESGALAVVACCANAKVAIPIPISSNNNLVFFMLPPTPIRFGLPWLSLSKDKGYSRKVTSYGGRVKVTRVFSPFVPKCLRGGGFLLVASVPAPL